MMNQIGEFFANSLCCRAIHVSHDIARRGVELNFRRKGGRVHGERTAMQFQNEGILFGRDQSRAVDDPALHAPVTAEESKVISSEGAGWCVSALSQEIYRSKGVAS